MLIIKVRHSIQRWCQRCHLRTIDLLHLSYLIITGLLIITLSKHQPAWEKYIGIRIVLGGCIIILNCWVGGMKQPKLFWRLLRDWYTPLFFIYYYEETEPLNQLVIPLYFDVVSTRWADIFVGRMSWMWQRRLYLDPFLEYWDGLILGFQPAVEFSRRFSSAWFSEIMHLGYFSYYILIPMLGAPLWFKWRQKEFDTFILKIAITMLCCYVFFIVFPTAGPKSYFPGANDRGDLNGYLFKWLMDIILAYGGISNGAFPSSHVAMATVILLCARKYERFIFRIMLPLVILLYISTVYLREHYFVDVPAGIMAGVFFYLLGNWLKLSENSAGK